MTAFAVHSLRSTVRAALCVVGASALTSACDLLNPGDDDSAAPVGNLCGDDPAPGTLRVLADLGTTSEGVAFSPDGRLFVGTPEGVVEVQPDGAVRPAGAVPSPVGLAPYDGGVIVASGDDGMGSGGIYYVDGSNEPDLWSVGLERPNFITATPWGTHLVSSPLGPGIVEVGAGGVWQLWSDAVPSPNGMVFEPGGGALFTVSTFQQEPPLWRVPTTDGLAGIPDARWVFPTGTAPDGVAMDSEGAVLILLNLTGQLVRFTEAEGALLINDTMTGPASIAIGPGGPWDPCEAIITSLYTNDLYAVRLSVPGP